MQAIENFSFQNAITDETLINNSGLLIADFIAEKFPENSIIGCIQHKNGSFSIANGDSIVTSDDIVKVFALPEAIKDVDKFFI